MGIKMSTGIHSPLRGNVCILIVPVSWAVVSAGGKKVFRMSVSKTGKVFFPFSSIVLTNYLSIYLGRFPQFGG